MKLVLLYSTKMNLFQSVEKNFEGFLGISREQHLLNWKILTAFICYWVDNALNCIFLIREVNSFSEIANSIFITSETTTIAICFTIWITQKDKMFHLIDIAEELADKGIIQISKATL